MTEKSNYLDTYLAHGLLDSELRLEITIFFARHPYARLNLYTIANAMDTARINLREDLRRLLELGILREYLPGDGLALYSLNEGVLRDVVKQIEGNMQELKTKYKDKDVEKILSQLKM